MLRLNIRELFCAGLVLAAGPALFPASASGASVQPSASPGARELAAEVRNQGWIAYGALNGAGDWDLFAMRPDGSDRRALTSTREYNEAGPRFSPNGRRLLYHRWPKSEIVNMKYGTHDLVIADADGGNPVVLGPGFQGASWGPDSSQIACLIPAGVQIVDLASREVVRQLPRRGITQQLVWSPDGQWFVGTANSLGLYWNIGCLSVKSGQIHAVSEVDRYNCTPDWTSDSQQVVYARGIIPQQEGRAELWQASRGGKERQMLFAEEGRHIYCGCSSPDGAYCLFTRSAGDFGDSGNLDGFTLAIIRRRDAPMIGDESASLRKRFPEARVGPWLDFGPGWEPHWTAADLKLLE